MFGKPVISFLLLLFSLQVEGQQLSQQLAEAGLSEQAQLTVKKQRPKRKGIQKLNPLSYIFDAGILTYQLVFSEQFQSDCQYEISCSEYTLRCIRKYGAVKGLVMGFSQLQDCHGYAKYEHEEVALTPEHKIKNASSFKTY